MGLVSFSRPQRVEDPYDEKPTERKHIQESPKQKMTADPPLTRENPP